MKFIIRNQAKISNKYIRFAKWKIRKLSGRFSELIYSEIYINRVSAVPAVYLATVKLGVPGPDIIVKAESQDLNELWSMLSAKIKRQLRKKSARNKH